MNEEINYNSLPLFDDYEKWDRVDKYNPVWDYVVDHLLLPPDFIKRYSKILWRLRSNICLFQRYPEFLFKGTIIPKIDACLRNSKINPIYNVKGNDHWFISYVLDSWMRLNIYKRVKLFSYYHLLNNLSTFRISNGDKILKVRVYWKDLIFPYYVDIDKVEVLRVYEIDDNFQKI